jgi:hypothetical protein
MAVLLYAKAGAPGGARLKELFETQLCGIEMETYETLESFSQRFSQPVQEPSVAILLFRNREDLMETLSIRHRIQDANLILILPDREEETIAAAHQLRPRFLTDLQNDLMTVTAVVEKMLKIQVGRPHF